MTKIVKNVLGTIPGEIMSDLPGVTIYGPVFDRQDGRNVQPQDCPVDAKGFAALAELPEAALERLGLVKAINTGYSHVPNLWLFPKEWYDPIPHGVEVVDFDGKPRLWDKGSMSDDHRFGALAYGILRK
jgi:hypothetical protein